MASLSKAPSLLASKSCPGTSPIFAIFATIGASSAVGRIGLHQLGEVVKIVIHIQMIDLIAHGSLHVQIVVHLAGQRRVGLSVRTKRDKRELVLQSVHLGVIIRRSCAVDSAENPDDACR